MRTFTREEMKSKAIEILEVLQVNNNLIRNYEKSDIVPFFSHGVSGFKDLVYKFLRDNKATFLDRYGECYAITLDQVSGYTMISFLCFSPNEEDQEYMLSAVDFVNYRVYAYVYNLAHPELSEYGSIIVTPTTDGLVRVG